MYVDYNSNQINLIGLLIWIYNGFTLFQQIKQPQLNYPHHIFTQNIKSFCIWDLSFIFSLFGQFLVDV